MTDSSEKGNTVRDVYDQTTRTTAIKSILSAAEVYSKSGLPDQIKPLKDKLESLARGGKDESVILSLYQQRELNAYATRIINEANFIKDALKANESEGVSSAFDQMNRDYQDYKRANGGVGKKFLEGRILDTKKAIDTASEAKKPK
jgi:hypothetical protein